MTPHRAEILGRVDTLHGIEHGGRRFLARACLSALAAEVERQAGRVFRRQPEPQRTHLLEAAKDAATMAASREPSDAVCARFGLDVAAATLVGTATDDEPPATWRRGQPLPSWGCRRPVYRSPTRDRLRRRAAGLIGNVDHVVAAEVELHVQSAAGSASVEHFSDAMRPPLDALALAAAWLSPHHGRVLAVELGTQAALEALSVVAGDGTVIGISTIWQPGSSARARTAIVNIPSARQYAWHRALARVVGLPESIRHILRHVNRRPPDGYGMKIIDLLENHLEPSGVVIVMADPEGGLHHRVLDGLLERGYESSPVNGVDTVESPTWVPVSHRAWSPVGGPVVTGRLVSMLRRGT